MPSETGTESFLTRLKNRLFSPRQGQEPQYPLGLNRQQVSSLQHLASTPQWRTFTEALQAVCDNDIARLISGLPHDEYLKKCGRIQALMDVLTLPETLDQKAKDLDEHQRRTRDPAPGKRDLTFFGSALWSPSRKPPIHGPDGVAGP